MLKRFVVLGIPCFAVMAYGGVLPAPSAGEACAKIDGDTVTIENGVIAVSWRMDQGTFGPDAMVDRISGTRWNQRGRELFRLTTDQELPASRFTMKGAPEVRALVAARGSHSGSGKEIRVHLACAEAGVEVFWRGILKDGAHYLRHELTFTGPAAGLPVTHIELLDMKLEGAAQIGRVAGSPVANKHVFAGVELPVTANTLDGVSVRAGFPCKLSFTPGRPYTFASVIGVYPEGQLRRAFLAYIEAERARPSRPFLHYNCWYDLGMNCTEDAIADVAVEFQEHLAKPFGLTIDSYVVDDGWDDYTKENRGTDKNGAKIRYC